MHSPLDNGLHPRVISERETSTQTASMHASSDAHAHEEGVVAVEHAGNAKQSADKANKRRERDVGCIGQGSTVLENVMRIQGE